MSNYTFDSDSLKYFLNKLKEKFALKSEMGFKVDKVDGKNLVTNDYTDEYAQLNNKAINDITISNEADTEITLTFGSKNGDSTSIKIPYDKHKKSALFVDAPEKFMCLANEENKINYRYVSSLKDGNHSLVVEIVKSTGTNTDYQESYTYDEIPDYYLYMPDGEDIALRMYFIDSENTMTGITYLEPEVVCLVAEYIINEINDNAYPNCNDGSLTNFITNDTQNDDNTFTRTVFVKKATPTKVDFRNTMGLTKINKIGSTITNMVNAFYNCRSLTGIPVCGDNVTDMGGTYAYCINITGNPVCGPNVINMSNAYQACTNLTGSPVCGPNVTNMYMAYSTCFNLTGSPVCGDKVTDMFCAYYYCTNLTGSPVCGNNVIDMYATYNYCTNLTGSPVCGSNVTNMVKAYCGCPNLYGNGYFFSNKVRYASSCFYGRNVSNRLNLYVPSTGYDSSYNTLNVCLYSNTSSLVGESVTWTNDVTANGCYYNTAQNIYIYPVTNVADAYDKNESKVELISYETTNPDNNEQLMFAVGADALENNDFIPLDTEGIEREITNIDDTTYNVSIYKTDKSLDIGMVAFAQDEGLTKLHSIGDCIKDIICMYCPNLTGEPLCASNMTAYMECHNLTGAPVCGPNMTNMSYAYYNCYNLTGSPVCENNVTDMSWTYLHCHNLTGNPVCGPNVTNMHIAYSNCHSLTGSPVCGDKVIDMYGTYSSCYNLTGSPVCGPNVTNMSYTYNFCIGLTGQPVCGDKVIDMAHAYQYSGVTGQPVCGPNVTNMSSAYDDCTYLTGNPVCGNNVTNMVNTYYSCSNLIGSPVCGPNVTNMYQTYYSCKNLSSNGYFYSNKITNAYYCFCGRNTNTRLNLYVPANSVTLNTCLSTSSLTSLTGTGITWTNSVATSGYYYNANRNIYIYPVANVEQAYKDNEKNN